jgi:hypothetical protein
MAANGWLAPEHWLKHLHTRFVQLHTCHSWSVCRACHTPLLINLHVPMTWLRGKRAGCSAQEEKSHLGGLLCTLLSFVSLLGKSEGVVRASHSLPAPHLFACSTWEDDIWCHLHLPPRRVKESEQIESFAWTGGRVSFCGSCKFCH